MLLLLSCFSRVQLCATPETAAHQAPLSLGFSRQEHWSGLPFLLQRMKVKSESEVAQLCPTLINPMDYSPPGSSIHGIFQTRVLEWVATAFSNYVSYKNTITMIHNFKKDLFIYLAVSGLSCSTQDLCCISQDLLFRPTNSLVVVLRLSCFTAWGILVLRPGIEPLSPVLGGICLTIGPPEKSHSGSQFLKVVLWQEGGPLPGPETRLLSNTRK